jgi:hypothetical protein
VDNTARAGFVTIFVGTDKAPVRKWTVRRAKPRSRRG